MNKKLKRTITKQLESLENQIEEIKNFGIEPDDPELWDADYYYDLAEKLKEILFFLEGRKGLLENLDEWETNQEQKDYDYEE